MEVSFTAGRGCRKGRGEGRNGEGAGRIRLRLDVEKVTDGAAEPVGHHVLLLGVDDQAEPSMRR
ncbi:hypothetical protein ACFV80_46000 [Streptomyces sp. NPDC059862]|uniref:hypothetical protein n=1 Tax=Streptomyces sp. NPDC059862 TaxID=3346975 RepID=UPI0036572CB1